MTAPNEADKAFSIAPWQGDAFLNDAASGAFQVEGDAADGMIAELEALQASLKTQLDETQVLAQPIYMSDSPAAMFVSQVMFDTANDQQGMRTQMTKAMEQIPKFIEGLQIAKRAYAGTEQHATTTIRSTGHR